MGPCESMAQRKAGTEGEKKGADLSASICYSSTEREHGDNQGWALITDILTVYSVNDVLLHTHCVILGGLGGHGYITVP